MPRTYNEGNVVCPFFNASTKLTISCEGITEDCVTKIMFTSPDKLDFHRKLFCDYMYKNCEIYRMLVKKYEEE